MTSDVDLERAAAGDPAARQELLRRFEDRIKRMVSVRLDPRLAARIDPSDVVQETYLEAWQKMSRYLENRPVAFYPWLRSIAWERLVDLHRAHIRAQKRSVERERRDGMALPEQSATQLVARLAANGTSPSIKLLRKEARSRLAEGLQRLRPADREVLVLRYLEQLSVRDIAAIVGVSQSAVKVRCFRAIERLHALLEDPDPSASRYPQHRQGR